jgi:flagellar biosynthesis protein FlhG
MAHERHARRLAVLSGKGGVGKTFVTANMAAELAFSGLRVMVLDANRVSATPNGARAGRTLTDFIRGISSLESVVGPDPAGFDLLLAGSGTLEGAVLTPALAYKIEHALRLLEDRYDVMAFDLGSGSVDVVLYFARLAHDLLLVVTPEPADLAEASAVIKALTLRYGRENFGIVVNRASPQRPEHEGMKVASKLQKAVERLLIKEGHPGVQLHLMACIASDPAVPESIGQRKILGRAAVDSVAARAIRKLAGNYGPNGFVV